MPVSYPTTLNGFSTRGHCCCRVEGRIRFDQRCQEVQRLRVDTDRRCRPEVMMLHACQSSQDIRLAMCVTILRDRGQGVCRCHLKS